jgi:hypothetical protein
MQQYPEVVSVYAEVPAYRVFVAFFEKYLSQEAPVAFRQLVQNLADFLLHFFMRENGDHIQRWIWNICALFLFGWILPASRPIVLEQYVVADRVHKGS